MSGAVVSGEPDYRVQSSPFDYFRQIEPAAALLGFAQTLTALDLFKLQRQLQQNFVLNSVAMGMGDNSQRGSDSEGFIGRRRKSETVSAPGERVDNVVPVRDDNGNCLNVDCEDTEVSNPVNLRQKSSPVWSSDSSECDGRKKGREMGQQCHESDHMVMNGKSLSTGKMMVMMRDDRCKSDFDGCQGSGSVVVLDDRDDDGRNDEDVVDPDCDEHAERINRCPVAACPTLSASVVAAGTSTTSFTIEHLIGRRT